MNELVIAWFNQIILDQQGNILRTKNLNISTEVKRIEFKQ